VSSEPQGGDRPRRNEDRAERSPERGGAPRRDDRPPYRGDRDNRSGGQRGGQGADRGGRDGGDRGGDRREGGFRGSRDGDNRSGGFRRDGDAPREGGFRGGDRREGGFRGGDNREGGFRGGERREGGFRSGPREGGADRREGGFRSGPREGGFRRDGDAPREGGFRGGERREGGFRSGPREGGAGPREGGFRSGPREGGFRRDGDAPREGGFRGGERREGGFRSGPREGGADRREGGFRSGPREGGADRREGGFRGGDNREGGYRGGQDRPRPERDRGDRAGYGDRPRRDDRGREGGYGAGPQRDRRDERRDGAGPGEGDRTVAPTLPDEIVASDLDTSVRAELLSLAKPVAETVARHLVATGHLIDEDPAEALAHAMAARRLASRISAVREAVGLAAYHAGEWQTAIAELRTYHRMTGLQSHLAVLADCERALGRPERAIDLYRGAEQDKLDPAVAIELLIVAAGARGDLGQKDAAVAMLQVRELTTDAVEPWTPRLRYAFAEALLAVGRREEAREWFSRAADVDADGETDAAERLLELDGVLIEGDEEDEETPSEELAAGPGAPGAVPVRPDAELTGDDDLDDEPVDDDSDDEDDRDEDDRDEDDDFDEDDDDLDGDDVDDRDDGDRDHVVPDEDAELTDDEAHAVAAERGDGPEARTGTAPDEPAAGARESETDQR
jgi:tetratricopeptide (TPR) repeat protein